MAEVEVDLSLPSIRDSHPDVVASLRQILGPVKVMPIAGNTVFAPTEHGGAVLRLNDGAGEVTLTIPTTAGAGHSFAIASPAGAWPRIVVGAGGALVHAFDHTRGLPKGLVSLLIVANDAGTPIVFLSGATQP